MCLTRVRTENRFPHFLDALYSILIFRSVMSAPHFRRSAATKSPKLLRSETTGSAISVARRSFTAGSCITARTPCSIVPTMSSGVPARTPMPNHDAVS